MHKAGGAPETQVKIGGCQCSKQKERPELRDIMDASSTASEQVCQTTGLGQKSTYETVLLISPTQRQAAIRSTMLTIAGHTLGN